MYSTLQIQYIMSTWYFKRQYSIVQNCTLHYSTWSTIQVAVIQFKFPYKSNRKEWESYCYSLWVQVATRSCCQSVCARHRQPSAPWGCLPRSACWPGRCRRPGHPTHASCEARPHPFLAKVPVCPDHSCELRPQTISRQYNVGDSRLHAGSSAGCHFLLRHSTSRYGQEPVSHIQPLGHR